MNMHLMDEGVYCPPNTVSSRLDQRAHAPIAEEGNAEVAVGGGGAAIDPGRGGGGSNELLEYLLCLPVICTNVFYKK